jgi:hypothetical protein
MICLHIDCIMSGCCCLEVPHLRNLTQLSWESNAAMKWLRPYLSPWLPRLGRAAAPFDWYTSPLVATHSKGHIFTFWGIWPSSDLISFASISSQCFLVSSWVVACISVEHESESGFYELNLERLSPIGQSGQRICALNPSHLRAHMNTPWETRHVAQFGT